MKYFGCKSFMYTTESAKPCGYLRCLPSDHCIRILHDRKRPKPVKALTSPLQQGRPSETPSAAPQPQIQQTPRQPPVGPPQQNTQFQNHQHFPSQQNQNQGPGRFNQQPNFPFQYPNQRFGPQNPQAFPPYGYPMPYGSPPPGWFPPPGQGFTLPSPGQFYPPPGPFGPPGQPPVQQGPQSRPQTTAQSTAAKEQAPAPIQQPIEKPAATVKLPTSPAPAVSAAPDGPPPPTESKPDLAAALAPPAPSVAQDAPAATKQVPNGQRSGRIMPAIPMLSPAVKAKLPVNGSTQSNAGIVAPASTIAQKAAARVPTQVPTKSLEDANRDARAAVAAAMAKLPTASGQPPKTETNGASAIDNLTNKVNEMRTHDNIRNSRQPGTGGYAAGHRGGRGGHRGGRPRDEQQAKKIELPKADYDFASANAKFNKQDLVKEAIASSSPISSPTDGSNPADLTANGARRESEASITIPAAASYNKTSSFFDNISSESKDRDNKKLGGREFRNEERNKNLETFGQGSVDNGYRGGFRGRGRGRGFRGGRGVGRGRGGTRGRGAAVAEN